MKKILHSILAVVMAGGMVSALFADSSKLVKKGVVCKGDEK